MKLYYKPGACSLASHIALYETGCAFDVEVVDTDTGLTATGHEYHAINPKGYVPALELNDGAVLTESAAILQFIADSFPQAKLAPAEGTIARTRIHEQLSWISTELHKAFGPLFQASATDDRKDRARKAVAVKFDLIETQLADGRNWLVQNSFSVADAYLFTVSNWANFTDIDLSRWPHLADFVTRAAARPSVQAAMRAEGLIQ